jgi:hypothetical protein
MENIALLYDQDYPLLPMYTRLFVKPRLSRFEAIMEKPIVEAALFVGTP